MNKRLERLKNSTWFGETPEIVTAAEGWQRRLAGMRFCSIHWWGDIPAGFTEFDYLEPGGSAFRVMLKDEPQAREDYLEADELVLLFNS